MSNSRIDHQKKDNAFYRENFQQLIFIFIFSIVTLIALVILLLYQLKNRPLPQFSAVSANSQSLYLTASEEPNLLPNTILTWASKAAVAVYTYNFEQTDNQVYATIQPYFTQDAGVAFYNSIQPLIQSIRQNKLITNCTLAGPPVIANQGELPGRGYTWRVQIPFLVTYQAAESSVTKTYRVTLFVVKMPTTKNPAGIAIDQFLM